MKRCKYEWEQWRGGKHVAGGCVSTLKAAKALAKRRRAQLDIFYKSSLVYVVRPDGSTSRA